MEALLSSIFDRDSQHSVYPPVQGITYHPVPGQATNMGHFYIVIRRNLVLDRIVEVTAAEASVGRHEKCHVCLPDSFVSRAHAIILHSDSHFYVRDLNSRNGTHFKGRSVNPEEPLDHGAELQIGPYCLTICHDLISGIRATVDTEGSTHPGYVSNEVCVPQIAQLTPAQRRVYDLLIEGLMEKEVAAKLEISIYTVHDHAKAIYRTLSVSTRGELIARSAIHCATQNGQ